MNSRQILIYGSCFSLGLAIFTALPILGRFIPGVGKGGLFLLLLGSVLGFFMTPIDYRGHALGYIVFFTIGFIVSSIMGSI